MQPVFYPMNNQPIYYAQPLRQPTGVSTLYPKAGDQGSLPTEEQCLLQLKALYRGLPAPQKGLVDGFLRGTACNLGLQS